MVHKNTDLLQERQTRRRLSFQEPKESKANTSVQGTSTLPCQTRRRMGMGPFLPKNVKTCLKHRIAQSWLHLINYNSNETLFIDPVLRLNKAAVSDEKPL